MNDSAILHSNEFANSGIVSGSFLKLDSDGGLELKALPEGTILEVKTKNHPYTLIVQPGGEMTIWGHPEYCPEPVTLKGVGASYITGVFREGYLAPGMRLCFPADGKRVTTSRIVTIERKRRN